MAAGTPAASITTSNPRPPVASDTCSANGAAAGSITLACADLERESAAMGLGLDQCHRAAHRGCRECAEQADRPAADDRHLVAGVDPVRRNGRAVCDRKRLDEGALRERELVGNAMQPGRLGDEVLRVGTADRESEVVVAVVHDALADDTVAGPQRGDVAADLCDLAGPLVTRDDRIRDRDDVSAFVELEVRVADTDVARAHQHLVRCDRGHVDVADHGALRLFEHQRLHSRSPPHWSISTLISSAVPDASSCEGAGRIVQTDVRRHDALDRQVAGGDLRGDSVEVVHPVAPGTDDGEVVQGPEHWLDRWPLRRTGLSARACLAVVANESRAANPFGCPEHSIATSTPRPSLSLAQILRDDPWRLGRRPLRPRAPRLAHAEPDSAPRRIPWTLRPSAHTGPQALQWGPHQ